MINFFLQAAAGVQTDAPLDYEELAAMRDEVVLMEQELLAVKEMMQAKMISLDEREHQLGMEDFWRLRTFLLGWIHR